MQNEPENGTELEIEKTGESCDVGRGFVESWTLYLDRYR